MGGRAGGAGDRVSQRVFHVKQVGDVPRGTGERACRRRALPRSLLVPSDREGRGIFGSRECWEGAAQTVHDPSLDPGPALKKTLRLPHLSGQACTEPLSRMFPKCLQIREICDTQASQRSGMEARGGPPDEDLDIAGQLFPKGLQFLWKARVFNGVDGRERHDHSPLSPRRLRDLPGGEIRSQEDYVPTLRRAHDSRKECPELVPMSRWRPHDHHRAPCCPPQSAEEKVQETPEDGGGHMFRGRTHFTDLPQEPDPIEEGHHEIVHQFARVEGHGRSIQMGFQSPGIHLVHGGKTRLQKRPGAPTRCEGRSGRGPVPCCAGTPPPQLLLRKSAQLLSGEGRDLPDAVPSLHHLAQQRQLPDVLL